MIKLMPFYVLLFSSNIAAQQENLNEKIHDYFVQLNLPQDSVKVKIISLSTLPSVCHNIKISRVSYKNPWGKISLPLLCDNKKYYIQANIEVTGKYWVTKTTIAKNTTLNSRHLVAQRGLLNKLPPNVIRQQSEWDGYITLHVISANQPITRTTLRKPWVITAGQHVVVEAKNSQFQITAEGKALNNATRGQQVRLRMHNGERINAIAQKEGYATILLGSD